MGWIAHDAIVVTTFQTKSAEAARDYAVNLGLRATDIVSSDVASHGSNSALLESQPPSAS